MSQTVDWNLLPNQPVRFFGLKSDFDRRALKRAYGKLIRRFKPETHPKEFQKIRQAYEELENQVRYGVKQKAIASQTEAWNAVVSAKSVSQDKSEKQTLNRTALAIKQPKETYQQLAKASKKSPQDYFLLAVLSDVAGKKEPHSFLRWLLRGMKEYPTDAGLQQLLREYLHSEVDLKSAASALQACSKTLRGDVFYRLTEPLWDRMVREAEFNSFAKLLASCEQNIKHKDGPSRVTFYLHVLRPAIWKATPEWSQRVFQFLESNSAQLDPEAEHELEFLTLVQDFLREDRDLVESSPLRQRIEDMIRSYCVDDWPTAVANVAQVQNEIARNAHGMVEAFPLGGDLDYFRLFSLCSMVCADVAQQTAVDFDSREGRHSEKQSFAALGDLRESIVPVVNRMQWLRLRSYVIPFVLLVLVPPIMVFAGASYSVIVLLGALGWVFGSICAYYLWLKPQVLDARVDQKVERMLTRAYEQNWRSRLFRYVQSCGEAPQSAIQKLYEAAQDTGDGNWMNVVLSFIQGDPGLILFGQAQMFVS